MGVSPEALDIRINTTPTNNTVTMKLAHFNCSGVNKGDRIAAGCVQADEPYGSIELPKTSELLRCAIVFCTTWMAVFQN